MIKKSSNKEFQELPDSWKVVKLGTVIDIQGGSQPPKKHFIYEPQEGYVRLLQIRDFGDKPAPTYVPKDMVTKFCTKEDIFIARYGASLGRIITGMEGAYNVALAKVIFDKETFFSKYFFYLLQTPYFQTPIHMISRSAQNGFNKGEIFPIKIPMAPINEQKRIVEEIEKQFSRLDEAVENLKRVKANLKRYKASVLKAAVEGKLTEEWRKANSGVEPAEKLLDRILVERRKKWEKAELAKMKAKGKEPKDDKWKIKYKKPILLDTSDFKQLPNRWVWTNISHIAESMKNGIYKPRDAYTKDGVACLRMYNIEDGTIVWKNIKRMKLSDAETEEYKLLSGDLLVNRVNSRELVGKAAPITDDLELCVFESKNIRVRLLSNFIVPEFVSFRIFVEGQAFFSRNAQQVVGMASISQPQLASLSIPLPPYNEQKTIIMIAKRHSSFIDKLENEIAKNLKRAVRLRQSILKKASLLQKQKNF